MLVQEEQFHYGPGHARRVHVEQHRCHRVSFGVMLIFDGHVKWQYATWSGMTHRDRSGIVPKYFLDELHTLGAEDVLLSMHFFSMSLRE